MPHSVSRRMPGTQPTVEIVVRRWVTPRSGRRSQAASTASRLSIGSPMPMNTQWSTGPSAAEVQRLVEDLRGRQVAREAHRAGRAEAARQRAARTARTGRPSAGRRGSASAPPRPGGRRAVANSALTVPSRARASRAQREGRERDLARRARAQRGRQVGHLLVAAGPAGGPRPHLAGAEGWLAGVGERARRGDRGPSPAILRSPCAWPSTSPTPGVASRRAAEEIVARRAGDGRRARSSPTPPATSTRRSGVCVDGARRWPGPRRASSTLLHKPRGRRLDGQRPARPPDRRRARSAARSCGCTRSGASTPTHRADPADQRRRARQPPHAPALRGAEDLPRAASAGGPSASAALRALREGVELEDGLTAPARVRRLAADEIELTIHEGRNRQVRRMCEAVGHPVRELARVRFGPLHAGGAGARRAPPADRAQSSGACAPSDTIARHATVRPARRHRRRAQRRRGRSSTRTDGADARRSSSATRSRTERRRQLHLHRHRRPRRRVPGGRRARGRLRPRAAAVRPRDTRSRGRCRA